MSGTLGTGYVVVTPVNLAVPPRELEGSKAGLLVLNWALVKQVNHTYVQPVNLLQLYQTGQFTTVQAVLVDNSLVGYPVRVASLSTGQRVTCPAYSQVMAPLLVSVAANFTVSLMLPSGVTTALDQVNTQVFFLNTPQAPYQVIGDTQANTGAASVNQTFPLTFPSISAAPQTVAVLAAFPPGSQLVTYSSCQVSIAPPPVGWLATGSDAIRVDATTTLAFGSTTLWRNVVVNQSAGFSESTTFTNSPTNSDGSATVLSLSIICTPGLGEAWQGGTVQATVNLSYNLTTVPQ